jgi:hypothetical protein
MRNGIEYCFVEVTCDDGAQYGLQAYGEEAKRLYNEVKYLHIHPIMNWISYDDNSNYTSR